MSWLSSAVKGVTGAVHDVRTALNLPPITIGNVAKVGVAAVTGGTSLAVGAVAGGSLLDKLKSGISTMFNKKVDQTVDTIHNAQAASEVVETVKSNGALIAVALVGAYFLLRKR